MKVVSVVGARPQFIKAAAVSRVLRSRQAEVLLHTGQHYDSNMSDIFFEELDIPHPDYNLGAGSGTHGAQTAVMLEAIEQVLLAERPDRVLVYGDTNSTLAGALAAAKLHIPVAHVEAGLRSFNRAMPEEVNRVLVDHLSSLLFCPSRTAEENLSREGIHSGVHVVGDVMADALTSAVRRAKRCSKILERLGLTPRAYLLVTVHRAENTTDASRMRAILSAFGRVDERVIFPLHPRTRRLIEDRGLEHLLLPNVHIIEPVGYLDMLVLENRARLILTDSGGVQKEAYWLGTPCLTLRSETEWVETVQAGWNLLVGTQTQAIIDAIHAFQPPAERPLLYGDGQAAERIVALLDQNEERVMEAP